MIHSRAFGRSISIMALGALLNAGCGIGGAAAPPADPIEQRISATTADDQLNQLEKDAIITGVKAALAAAGAKEAGDFVAIFLNLFFQAVGWFQSSATTTLATLSAQLTQVEGNLAWYINTLDTADHVAEILSDVQAAGEPIEQSQADPTNPNLKFTTASPAFLASSEHLAVLEESNHFLRRQATYSDQITDVLSADDLADARPISIPEDPGGHWVYDWRAELPRMMIGIASRIGILSVADPGFQLSSVRSEIMGHYNVLLGHYNRIWAGIKCNHVDSLFGNGQNNPGDRLNGAIVVTCADIHTGKYLSVGIEHGNIDNDHDACITNPGGYPANYDPQCMSAVDAKWSAMWDNVYTAQFQLRRQLLQTIPFFQIHSMLDGLYHYANPGPDLTEMQKRIPAKYHNYFCLDVQWANSTSGTPIWMWQCTGSVAQQWHYDRTNGTITNTTMNKCMEANVDGLVWPSYTYWPWSQQDYYPHLTTNGTQGGPTQLTSVQPYIADCNGSEAQQWSFDPAQDVLFSGANSTTALRAAQSQEGFPWLDWKDETPGSLWGYFLDPYWKVDTVNPCVTQNPLSSGQDNCVDQICGADSFCCGTFWDGICVGEVGSVCGQACPSQ